MFERQYLCNEKAPTGYAKRVVSLPVGAVRRESARSIASLRRPVSRKVGLTLHLWGTQISLVGPFAWGWLSASVLLASRLMPASTSIAIVHQIDFMDSSRSDAEVYARELPDP